MFDKLIDVLSYDMVYDLAKMSRNVYYKLPKYTSWLNVSLPQVFDTSIDNDTVRSYLFTNSDRSINVIAFKGTSLPWFSFTTDDIEDQGTFNDDVVRQQGTFNDDVVTLVCKHSFHKACLQSHIQFNNNICPMCRRELIEELNIISKEEEEIENDQEENNSIWMINPLTRRRIKIGGRTYNYLKSNGDI